jgi:hypothetical protein
MSDRDMVYRRRGATPRPALVVVLRLGAVLFAPLTCVERRKIGCRVVKGPLLSAILRSLVHFEDGLVSKQATRRIGRAGKPELSLSQSNHDEAPTPLRYSMQACQEDARVNLESHLARALDHLVHQPPVLEGRESTDVLHQERAGIREFDRVKERFCKLVARVIKRPLSAGGESLTGRPPCHHVDVPHALENCRDRLARNTATVCADTEIVGERIASGLPRIDRTNAAKA